MSARVGTLVVGGGPAALAPLVSASRDGRLADVLDAGVGIAESGVAVGPGSIGSYGIGSDSTAETFMAAVSAHADPRMGAVEGHPTCREVAAYGKGPIPLRLAGELQSVVGGALSDMVVRSGGFALTGTEALWSAMAGDGWETRLRDRASGDEWTVRSGRLVVATGGVQSAARLAAAKLAGVAVGTAAGSRLVGSDDLLRAGGVGRMLERLRGARRPRVAIVGGSASALAAAVALLRGFPEGTWDPGAIRILHRRPLRVFYPSAAAALSDGYRDFGSDDICPVSGFVHRLGGFRLESRDLVMSMLGIRGRAPERRVVSVQVGPGDGSLVRTVLGRSDAVVAATGYRPRLLPLRDAAGAPLPLAGEAEGAPAADGRCRMLRAGGGTVPGVSCIGLAAGFRPSGPLGGEPSFRGQANGLWLWQTAVGAMVVDDMLDMSSCSHPYASQAEPRGLVMIDS